MHGQQNIKIALLHQVGISDYFTRKMHGQTTLKLEFLEFTAGCLHSGSYCF